jgi:hypothetical protein
MMHQEQEALTSYELSILIEKLRGATDPDEFELRKKLIHYHDVLTTAELDQSV